MSYQTVFQAEFALDKQIKKSDKGLSVKERTLKNGIRETRVNILTEDAARAYRKPVGEYVTIDLAEISREADTEAEAALARELKKFLPRAERVLCAGLGNREMTADALGPIAVSLLDIGRVKPTLYGLSPGVLGATGIETGHTIRGVVNEIKPDAVILIDSLASKKTRRIGASFQITDTGLVPGAGVGNARAGIDSRALGIPVVAIGVPLVVYAHVIISEVAHLAGADPAGLSEFTDEVVGDLVVTPKDIDLLVRRCAAVVSGAINSFMYA